jgi:hypothetical protein
MNLSPLIEIELTNYAAARRWCERWQVEEYCDQSNGRVAILWYGDKTHSGRTLRYEGFNLVDCADRAVKDDAPSKLKIAPYEDPDPDREVARGVRYLPHRPRN